MKQKIFRGSCTYTREDGLPVRKWLMAAFLLCATGVHAQDWMHYVQPLSGTAPATTASALKHSMAGSEGNANTIPAVGPPFAMTQWTPQTRAAENKCIPPYYYKDSLISGFRGTHWLSGSCTQDYGSFTVMPVAGHLRTLAKDYAIPFSHSDEITTPAYYELTTHDFVSEITSTLRCGVMRFTMLRDDSLHILVIPNSDRSEGMVAVDAGKGEVWGYNPVHRIYQGWGKPAGFSGWFFLKFETKMLGAGTFSGDTLLNSNRITAKKDPGAFASFYVRKGEQLVIRIGTSFSSLSEARNNLESEVGSMSFNEVKENATRVWNRALSQIKVTTVEPKNKKIFYTALYHAMELPRIYNDADGTYPEFSGGATLHHTEKGAGGYRNYYGDFSMWDIYRAQLPLLEILQPERIGDMVQSMVIKGQQGGWLPIFPCWNSYTAAMVGDHVTAFIASAYAKGIRNYDVKEAYRLMRQNAFDVAGTKDYLDGKGRRALWSYLKYHFIPVEDSVPDAFHKKEQVSRTLEYAYDDYALYVMAAGLGKTKDRDPLFQRALNYRNVFDPSVSMVRGRHEDGSWLTPFYPDRRDFYITEGTPRQYTFYVPQDVPGLAALMGGREKLESALDQLFEKGEYWHGNEPGHQIPFMYNYTGAPWKSQQMVRKILSEEYSDGPGGLSGNDDAGQMSAWYVMAAMGFYPLDPVSGNYLLVSPLFDTLQIRLENHKSLEIICHKKNSGDFYIQKVEWNGKPYENNYITHALLSKGGRLEMWLQDHPSSWGSLSDQQPAGLKKSE